MNARTILVVSVVLNLGLGVAAGYFLKSGEKAPETTAGVQGDGERAELEKRSNRKPVPQQGAVSTERAKRPEEFHWQQVASPDYKSYMAHLREIECPEETIRDIITAEVNKFFGKKIRALRYADGEMPYKYWESGRSYNSKERYARERQIRALEREKSALLKELLGVDPNEEIKKENNYVDYWERNFAFVQDDRKEKVREIQEKYGEMEQEINRTGFYDEEDRKKLKDLYQERLRELSAILNPKELEEYDLRASRVASQLRSDVEVSDVSEEEFRKIFALRKGREEDLEYPYDQEDKAGQERRRKAVEEVDEQVKSLIGPERFVQYQRSQDWNYKELVRLVERQELPREAADKVFDIKKDSEDAVKSIRENKNLTSQERDEALKKIGEETQKALTSALGSERTVQKYRKRGGWWINNVVPNVRSSK